MRYLIYNHNNTTFVVTTKKIPGKQEPCASVFSSNSNVSTAEKYIKRRYSNPNPHIIYQWSS